MSDEFSGFITTKSDPGERHWQIVPDDDNDVVPLPRAIYCHETGTIVVRDKYGTDLSYEMDAGEALIFRAVRILQTGTTGVFYGWS